MKANNIHENLQRNHGFKVATPAQFGVNMTKLFCFLGVISFFYGSRLWTPFLILGLLFLLAAIFTPFILAPVNAFWTSLGLVVAKFSNPIILFLTYIILITPIAILYRAFSKNSFKRKVEDNQSTWEKPSASRDLTQQF